jgi:hypothetical protein
MKITYFLSITVTIKLIRLIVTRPGALNLSTFEAALTLSYRLAGCRITGLSKLLKLYVKLLNDAYI